MGSASTTPVHVPLGAWVSGRNQTAQTSPLKSKSDVNSQNVKRPGLTRKHKLGYVMELKFIRLVGTAFKAFQRKRKRPALTTARRNFTSLPFPGRLLQTAMLVLLTFRYTRWQIKLSVCVGKPALQQQQHGTCCRAPPVCVLYCATTACVAFKTNFYMYFIIDQ